MPLPQTPLSFESEQVEKKVVHRFFARRWTPRRIQNRQGKRQIGLWLAGDDTGCLAGAGASEYVALGALTGGEEVQFPKRSGNAVESGAEDGVKGTAGAPMSGFSNRLSNEACRSSTGDELVGTNGTASRGGTAMLSGFVRRRSKPGTRTACDLLLAGSPTMSRSKISGSTVPGSRKPACFKAPAANELLFWEVGRYS